jgi:nitrite reductase (NADH) small subunit
MATENRLVRLCGVSELPLEGEAREIQAGAVTLCVARVDGRLSVLDNECPHHGGPLGQGTIENGKIVCPWHAYAFDVSTGICEEPKERVRVYNVITEGNDVMVTL